MAISYYSLGLIGYAGKAMHAANLPVNPDVLTGAMVPLVVLGVLYCLRKLHHQLQAGDQAPTRHGA